MCGIVGIFNLDNSKIDKDELIKFGYIFTNINI